MRVAVLSVPHTGTRFLRDHLLYPPGQFEDFWQHHTFPRSEELVADRVARFDHVIVPMRHPLLVAQSWKSRNKNHLDARPFWEILINIVDPVEPLYLPMDRPDREEWLDAIRNALGKELPTDWQVVSNDAPVYTLMLEHQERDAVRAWMVKRMAFFEKFGYTRDG